jgi:hypothetical protein
MDDEDGSRCEGTVVVHKDGAVSCTANECNPHLRRRLWFSLHMHFVHCVDAMGGSGCAECGFADMPEVASTKTQV